MLLHQCHHALIERAQMRIADKQPCQNQKTHAGDEHRGIAMPAQATGCAQTDHHSNAADNNPGLEPEAFGQWQADCRARGPARHQISHRPACAGQQADGEETRERHVAHSGHHRQHWPQGADKAPNQQAGDAVALEV
ncbi:hypothetical protein D9M73_161020 [compost metagenome]